MKLKKKFRGFTLIELLVVVLILSILMAVALPLYLSAIADSKRKTCRANMQTIANAIHARAVATRSELSTVAAGGINTGNLPDLNVVPRCPDSTDPNVADYTPSVVNGVVRVTCGTNADHGAYTMGDVE